MIKSSTTIIIIAPPPPVRVYCSFYSTRIPFSLLTLTHTTFEWNAHEPLEPRDSPRSIWTKEHRWPSADSFGTDHA
jgi:hypothetical protein